MSNYTVTIGVFQGPLDLLLMLIEKRKLLINDVSLAQVTDDFIAHVESGDGITLSDRAHFIFVASTLLFIKSKSLLPSLELSEEESESVEDLEHRLKFYKKFRELSHGLEEQFEKHALYTPKDAPPRTPLFSPTNNVKSKQLLAAVHTILRSLPTKEFVPKVVVEKVMSIEEMIDRLTERISKHLSLSFQEFVGLGKEEKLSVIVGFLAMLELAKQGIISVTQDSLFSDITMETDSVNTPRYG